MSFLPPVTIETGGSLFNTTCPVNDPQFQQVIAFGSKLYTLASRFAGNTVAAYSSSDLGATWVRLDSAHEPNIQQNAGWVRNGNTFRAIVDDVAGHAVIYDFDLATELWSGVVSTSPFLMNSQKGLWINGAGDLIFLYLPPGGPNYAIRAVKFSAGWGAPINVDVQNPYNGGGTGKDPTPNVGGCIDGNILHVVFSSQDSSVLPTVNWKTIYQQVDTASMTLGPSNVFPVETNSFIAVGIPGVFGANLVIPFFIDNLGDPNNRTAGMYSGPKTGGPFVLAGPIDPGFGTDPTLIQIADQCGFISVAGATLYFMYACQNQAATDSRGRVRALTTTDLSTWTGETVFDNSADTSTHVLRIVTIGFDASSTPLVMFNGFNGAGLQQFFSPGTPVPPPVTVTPTPPSFTSGGGPYVIPKKCLCDVSDLAFEALGLGEARRREWPYRWKHPPPSAIRVTAQGRIAIPTVAAGETVGFTYTVDQGSVFALEELIVEPFAGAVSPGDFLWSLDLNAPENSPAFQGCPIQGFTLVDVPLGSTEFAWPLECPEIFQANDTIRAKFTNVNLPDGAPNYFKTMLLGWRWAVA